MTGSLQTFTSEIPFSPTFPNFYMDDPFDGHFKPPSNPNPPHTTIKQTTSSGSQTSNRGGASGWGSPDVSNRGTPMSLYSSFGSPNPSSTPERGHYFSPQQDWHSNPNVFASQVESQTSELINQNENPFFEMSSMQHQSQETNYSVGFKEPYSNTGIGEISQNPFQIAKVYPMTCTQSFTVSNPSISSSGPQQFSLSSSSLDIPPFAAHFPSENYDISFSLNDSPSPSASQFSSLQTFPSVSQTSLSYNDALSANISLHCQPQEEANQFSSSSQFQSEFKGVLQSKGKFPGFSQSIPSLSFVQKPEVFTSQNLVNKEQKILLDISESRRENTVVLPSDDVPFSNLPENESTNISTNKAVSGNLPSTSFEEFVSSGCLFGTSLDGNQAQLLKPTSQDLPTYQELHPFGLGESAWRNEAKKDGDSDWTSMEIPLGSLFSPGSQEVWKNLSDKTKSNSPTRKRSVSRSPLSVAGVEEEFSSHSSDSSVTAIRYRKKNLIHRREKIHRIRNNTNEGISRRNSKEWSNSAGTYSQRKEETERKEERVFESAWQSINSPVNMETETADSSHDQDEELVVRKTREERSPASTRDRSPTPEITSNTEERSDEEDNRIRLTAG